MESTKLSINKYQNKYYHEHMNDEEWKKHRAEVVRNNMRKMRAKKKEQLIAAGNPPKLGRKAGGKNKPKEESIISTRVYNDEPPELYNIVL